jgi:hypothetical protein
MRRSQPEMHFDGAPTAPEAPALELGRVKLQKILKPFTMSWATTSISGL